MLKKKNTAVDKKLNIAARKIINIDKKQYISAIKPFNTIAYKAVMLIRAKQ